MNIYTFEQWEKDGDLKVEVGQFIDDRVFYDLLGSVPPATYSRGVFQPGEPYTHDFKTGRALYNTFKKNAELWQYVGLMVLQEG